MVVIRGAVAQPNPCAGSNRTTVQTRGQTDRRVPCSVRIGRVRLRRGAANPSAVRLTSTIRGC